MMVATRAAAVTTTARTQSRKAEQASSQAKPMLPSSPSPHQAPRHRTKTAIIPVPLSSNALDGELPAQGTRSIPSMASAHNSKVGVVETANDDDEDDIETFLLKLLRRQGPTAQSHSRRQIDQEQKTQRQQQQQQGSESIKPTEQPAVPSNCQNPPPTMTTTPRNTKQRNSLASASKIVTKKPLPLTISTSYSSSSASASVATSPTAHHQTRPPPSRTPVNRNAAGVATTKPTTRTVPRPIVTTRHHRLHMSTQDRNNDDHPNVTMTSAPRTITKPVPSTSQHSSSNNNNNKRGSSSRAILITCGCSVIGYRVALFLLERGYIAVKVGLPLPMAELLSFSKVSTRSQQYGWIQQVALTLRERGAELVHWDWQDPCTFATALRGSCTSREEQGVGGNYPDDEFQSSKSGAVQSVFCTVPHITQGSWAVSFPAFIRACQQIGHVQHIVKLSPIPQVSSAIPVSVGNCNNTNFATCHQTCDALLQQIPSHSQHRIHVSLLYCSNLMSAPLLHPLVFQQQQQQQQQQPEHEPSPLTFLSASYGMPVPYISPNDVAEVAVQVLLQANQRRHQNTSQIGKCSSQSQIYYLVNPERLTDADWVETLQQQVIRWCRRRHDRRSKTNMDPRWRCDHDQSDQKQKNQPNDDNLPSSIRPSLRHVSLDYDYYQQCLKKHGLPGWWIRDAMAVEHAKAMNLPVKTTSHNSINDSKKGFMTSSTLLSSSIKGPQHIAAASSTDWIRLLGTGRQAETCAQYLDQTHTMVPAEQHALTICYRRCWE